MDGSILFDTVSSLSEVAEDSLMVYTAAAAFNGFFLNEGTYVLLLLDEVPVAAAAKDDRLAKEDGFCTVLFDLFLSTDASCCFNLAIKEDIVLPFANALSLWRVCQQIKQSIHQLPTILTNFLLCH